MNGKIQKDYTVQLTDSNFKQRRVLFTFYKKR